MRRSVSAGDVRDGDNDTAAQYAYENAALREQNASLVSKVRVLTEQNYKFEGLVQTAVICVQKLEKKVRELQGVVQWADVASEQLYQSSVAVAVTSTATTSAPIADLSPQPTAVDELANSFTHMDSPMLSLVSSTSSTSLSDNALKPDSDGTITIIGVKMKFSQSGGDCQREKAGVSAGRGEGI